MFGNCECDCVKALAEQLEKRKGDFVIVYEKNAFILGTIKDVKDDSVLILDGNPTKFAFFQDNAGNPVQAAFLELIVSICEITEFGVVTEAQRNAILNSFQ